MLGYLPGPSVNCDMAFKIFFKNTTDKNKSYILRRMGKKDYSIAGTPAKKTATIKTWSEKLRPHIEP